MARKVTYILRGGLNGYRSDARTDYRKTSPYQTLAEARSKLNNPNLPTQVRRQLARESGLAYSA